MIDFVLLLLLLESPEEEKVEATNLDNLRIHSLAPTILR